MTALPPGATENPWDLFPHHRHIGTDDCGNEIVVDRSGDADGPVYGLWHDPPAIVVLARSEAAFRRDVPDFSSGDPLPMAARRRVNEALEPDEPGAIPLVEAGRSLGAGFESWLAGLPAGSVVYDLRQGRPGSGFELGARSQLMRHPASAVFAVFDPPRPPGLLARLLGRG